MKKLLIRSTLLLFVFAVVFAGVYFYQNREPEKEMIQMDKASLPVLYMEYGQERINRLHGYVQDMDSVSMRDSLTPVPEDRTLRISVDMYGNSLTGISYEVRSLDKERLLEKTTITDWDSRAGRASAELKLENLMETGEEYLLTICLSTERQQEIKYYTRIQMGVGQIEEKIAYTLDFSQKTFQKEEAESLIMYLESGARGDNTNFGNVDIYSSFDQITWGKLEPVRLTEPIPTITEVNGNITSIRLEYQVEIKNMYGTTEVCNVNEFYRTNYTPDRMYLLTYERKMDQNFRAVSENVTTSRINLGILSNMEIPIITNKEGRFTAFTTERELWAYDNQSNLLECIFSFRDIGDDGVRDEWDQHEIVPVQVDENGDIYFIVYGYMNRGYHEGCVGVALYAYKKEGQIVEEIFFLPYQQSFAYLQQNLGELFHITPGRHFCFLLDNRLYSVDLASLEYVCLVEGLTKGSYVINKDGNMIAWQPEKDILNSFQIKKMDLDANTEDMISSSTGRIQVMGFIENDLVYGTVLEEDIKRTTSGDIRTYMTSLHIVDKNNRQVGSYYKEGYYITEAKIEENRIILARFQKTESGAYIEAEDDYITNNTAISKNGISISTIATELKKKETGINLLANTTGKSLSVTYSQEVIYPEGRELLIHGEIEEKGYYVYAKGKLQEFFVDVPEAIRLADEQAGVVVDTKGNYIWRRGNRNTSILLDISMPESEGSSLAKVLDALLRYASGGTGSEEKLAGGMSVLEIIEEGLRRQGTDLTGCSLRQVLYFVDSGRPVIVRLSEEEYGLIIGFDAYNAVLLDTSGRKAYRIGLEDGTELFQRAGNEFITYQ